MVSISKSHHLLFLFLLLIGITQAMPRKLNEEASMREKYEQWMSKFGKAYTNGAEKEKRFLIFKENVEFIESFNAAGNKSYELGVNHLADLTVEEFNAYSNGYKRFSNDESVITPFKYENVTAISAALDWRAKGAVTPIKQQGSCGSCWAFSSIATTEGLHKITTGKLVSLSEQELMDCDRHFGIEHGCEGGGMNDGFEYMIQNGGITSEANYPYKAKDGICDKNKAKMHVAKIKGYEKVPINSEVALLKAVANQPVSVAIDANNQGFRFYKRGIFTGNCGTKLDHGVTIVGYGRANGIDYWLVKNSWSTAWGEQGYIRMKRGIADKRGLCGIAMEASYPLS